MNLHKGFANLRLRSFLGIFLLASALTTSQAQENSGLLTGTVTDATGASVPGATVSATSPTLPRAIEATSDDNGHFLLPQVPIGSYTVTVTKPGFSKLIQHGVEIRLGSQVTLAAKLAVSAVSEVVEVTETAASIDPTSSTTSTNITAKEFDNLPRGRNFHTLLAMAPGVRQEVKNGNAGVGGFQVDGASGSENIFILDGVDVSDIRRGSLRVQNSIPFEFIQEIQIKSSGFGAEYGGATGGVINVATKAGSNTFHGEGWLQWSLDAFNPRPRGYWQRSPLNANAADFFAPKKDDWSDYYPGGTFNGPILKNSLFFSLGYSPQISQTTRTINYASGTRQFQRTDLYHYSLARLDWNPLSKLQVNSSWLWSPWKQNGVLQNPDIRVAAPTNDLGVQGGYQPAQTVNVSGTYTITPKWLFTARFGYKYQNDKIGNYGLSGAPFLTYQTASSQSPVAVPDAFTGGSGYRNVTSTLTTVKDITTRRNIYLDSSYIANIGGQQHLFKFGYYQARVSNDVSTDYTNGRFLIYWGDKFSRASIQNETGTYGYYTWEDGVRNLGNVFSRNQGFYITDGWKIHPRVTLNIGVRFENEYLPPYKQGENGRTVANPVSFDWGSKIAPRIGGAWDILGDGKWKLSGSFSVNYDVLKYELARGSFGSDYWVTSVYKLDNPNVLSLSRTNPGALGPTITTYNNRSLPLTPDGQIEGIDRDIKPYQQREYTLSLARQLTANTIGSIRYTRKNLIRAIEDIGVLDSEGSEVYVIGNPGFGQTRDTSTFYGGKTPSGEWLVPKAVRDYDAVEFRVDGRFIRRLTGSASYTWSRLYGNYSGAANSDESGRSDPGVSRAYDLPYYYFDDTGSQKTVLGRLGTDRPHTLKLFASYETPTTKFGSTQFGLQQFAWSGTPDTTTMIYLSAPTSPYGRGDLGRTPALTQTDLSIVHTIKPTERFTVRLEAYASNLFNQASVVARVTQLNRAGAVSEAALPLSKFFAGYDPKQYVTVGGTVPYNPIYSLPGGTYNNGGAGGNVDSRGYGPTGYQGPRSLRFGLRFLF